MSIAACAFAFCASKSRFKSAASASARNRFASRRVKESCSSRAFLAAASSDSAAAATSSELKAAKAALVETGNDYDAALKDTPTLLEEVNALLLDLDGLIEGEESVHSWGVSMEDITTLPDMKTLSCVDGIVWPSRVRRWVDTAYGKCAEHMELYDRYKC